MYKAKRYKRNKPMEMKKRVMLGACAVGGVATVVSFVLAAFDKNPVENLSMSIIAAVTTIITGYITASTVEKTSRNKHHVDADGIPFDLGGYNVNTDDTQ